MCKILIKSLFSSFFCAFDLYGQHYIFLCKCLQLQERIVSSSNIYYTHCFFLLLNQSSTLTPDEPKAVVIDLGMSAI